MSLIVIICIAWSVQAFAVSVKAVALFNDRAMLSIDGEKPKIIGAGKTFSGVKLISSNTSEAVVEVDGKRQTLKLNGTLVLNQSLGNKVSSSYNQSIQLFVNDQGFFQSNGTINSKTVNFLVDTGANLVVLSSTDAKKINLDYEQGVRSLASTASGTAPMYVFTVDTMSIGGIELNDVEMGVIEGDFPVHPLLGMTFLSRLNMKRAGNVMTLNRR